MFDHGKPEVRGFLIANALYWLGELHLDGLRVDAVASMLYRDYSRSHGQWTPNVHGGNEDLEAVAFLQEMNTTVHRVHPGVHTIAEESTAWPGVTRPVHDGGLGFTHKWNMGWMHDTLDYWSTDPYYRGWHHNQVTFGLTYAWAEHFLLALSHDEVVHLKRSLLGKMPGSNDDERFANLRALYTWMWAHPGKQLLFMGGELADPQEWSHDRGLDWSLAERDRHAGVLRLIGDLNAIQAHHPVMHVGDGDPAAFSWLAVDDSERSTFAFERRCPAPTTWWCAWPTSRASTSTTTASACAAPVAGAASSPATTPATGAPAPGYRTSNPSPCRGTTVPTAPPSPSPRSPSSTSSLT